MTFFTPFTAWRGSGSQERLLAAAQGGDRDAFDKLARAHTRPLRGYIARRVGPDGAEDVLQETWIAVWGALGAGRRPGAAYGSELRGPSRFPSWLYGIAAHKCADYLRARGRTATVDMPQDLEQAAGRFRRDPYAQVVLKHVVADALAGLPDAQREVLEMYYYAELTLPEIARSLKRNLNTVKYQFYRAHAQVSARLEGDDAGANLLEPAAGERLP